MEVGGGNPKSVWWNDQVKATVNKKEVLGAKDEDVRERCMETYKEKKRKVKRSIWNEDELRCEWK